MLSYRSCQFFITKKGQPVVIISSLYYFYAFSLQRTAASKFYVRHSSEVIIHVCFRNFCQYIYNESEDKENSYFYLLTYFHYFKEET